MAIAVLEQHEIEAIVANAFERGMERGTELTISLFNKVDKFKPKNKGILLNQKQAADLLGICARSFKTHYQEGLTAAQKGKHPKFYEQDILDLKERIDRKENRH